MPAWRRQTAVLCCGNAIAVVLLCAAAGLEMLMWQSATAYGVGWRFALLALKQCLWNMLFWQP
jgi:hypothetical protein